MWQVWSQEWPELSVDVALGDAPEHSQMKSSGERAEYVILRGYGG